jgi:hypothetical protein
LKGWDGEGLGSEGRWAAMEEGGVDMVLAFWGRVMLFWKRWWCLCCVHERKCVAFIDMLFWE